MAAIRRLIAGFALLLCCMGGAYAAQCNTSRATQAECMAWATVVPGYVVGSGECTIGNTTGPAITRKAGATTEFCQYTPAPPTCSEDDPPLTSSSGWEGPAQALRCSDGCTYAYDPCSGGNCDLNLEGMQWHYGQYQPTGETCGTLTPPVPEDDPDKCADLGGGYKLCQNNPNSPPCIVEPNGTRHCIYPPGPVCSQPNGGAGGSTCIGNPPPTPPQVPGQDPPPPPICGETNNLTVCFTPPGAPSECPEGTTGEPPNCVPEEPEDNECPEGQVGVPPNCEEEEESMASDAPCGMNPSCEGDAILCAQLLKQHQIKCEVEHGNDLLANFRNKQISEVQETNTRLAKMMAAQQIATTQSTRERLAAAEKVASEVQQTNNRLANISSALNDEGIATRARLGELQVGLTGDQKKTISDLDAKMALEIEATNDLVDVLNTATASQQQIIEMIESDTEINQEKLDALVAQGVVGYPVGDCVNGSFSCPADSSECNTARMVWLSMCSSEFAINAVTAAVNAQGGAVVDAVTDKPGTDLSGVEAGIGAVVAAINAQGPNGGGTTNVDLDDSGIIAAIEGTRQGAGGAGSCEEPVTCTDPESVECFSLQVAHANRCVSQDGFANIISGLSGISMQMEDDGSVIDVPGQGTGLIESDDGSGLLNLINVTGFLSDRSCPIFPAVNVSFNGGAALDLNNGGALCDVLLAFRFLMVAMAWYLVGRILLGAQA